MSDTDEAEVSALAELKPFNGSKIIPVVARACEGCKWSATEQNDLVCRRHPPQVTFMAVPQMVPTPQGPKQAMMAKAFTGFPVIRRDQWCGEFAQKSARV